MSLPTWRGRSLEGSRAWASRRVIAWRSSSAAGVGFVEKFWALQLLDAVPCAFNPVTLRRDA